MIYKNPQVVIEKPQCQCNSKEFNLIAMDKYFAWYQCCTCSKTTPKDIEIENDL